MKLEVKNFQLVPIINFLTDMTLKGKESRARIKLITRMNNKREEVAADIEALGPEPESNPDPEVEMSEELKKHRQEVSDILNETSIIDMTEYENKMPYLLRALEDYDIPLSGQDAGTHDLLMDLLEDNIKSESPEVEVIK